MSDQFTQEIDPKRLRAAKLIADSRGRAVSEPEEVRRDDAQPKGLFERDRGEWRVDDVE